MSRPPAEPTRADAAEPPPLRLLFWESTARCNLACIHCRRLEADDSSADDLTTEEARSVLNSAVRLGRPIIVFSGGEPLLRPDWPALADHARSVRLPTALATNGTLIDATAAGQIAAAGFRRVAVSLDGADAETHDGFRGVSGAFERALAGVAALREAGAAVQINATIAAHNAEQLDALYVLAESLGAAALHLFLLVPVGCGVQIAETHRLSADRCEAILGWVLDRQQAGRLELRATCAPQYHRLAVQRGLAPRGSRGCLAGIAVAFVSHAGEVFPCGYLPVSCGSVRQQALAEIWRGSEVLAALRNFDRLKGKCGRCEFKAICGGCRARAFAATGDYLAAEPACAYSPPEAAGSP